MSQRKRLKKPKVKGAERRAAIESAAAEASSAVPHLMSPGDHEWVRRSEAERKQRSRQLLDEAAQEADRLFVLVAQLRALPQWRSRKRESLLSAARFHETTYRSSLERWLERYGEEPVPDTTPKWLAEDLEVMREQVKAEKLRRAAAEESSKRFAEEVRPGYRVGDEDSFQEFAKRFIYDQ